MTDHTEINDAAYKNGFIDGVEAAARFYETHRVSPNGNIRDGGNPNSARKRGMARALRALKYKEKEAAP